MSDYKVNVDPDSQSLQDILMLSALLCGVQPGWRVIHRLQLFFCANFVIKRRNAEEDFQRCIQNEADRDQAERMWERIDEGVYALTMLGYTTALAIYPNTQPLFSPSETLEDVNYSLTGYYLL